RDELTSPHCCPRGAERGNRIPPTEALEEVPMSALGQKQTFALHQPMSALPPIATAKADFPQKSCPLYPPKADMCGATRDVRFGPKADMGLGLSVMSRHVLNVLR